MYIHIYIYAYIYIYIHTCTALGAEGPGFWDTLVESQMKRKWRIKWTVGSCKRASGVLSRGVNKCVYIYMHI